MRLVATLVGPAAGSLVDHSLIQSLSRCLMTHGAVLEAEDWLSEGEACDIFFNAQEIQTTKELLSTELLGTGIDFALQPPAGRRKNLLVADMESTIIPQEMIDELALRQGIGEEIAVITHKSMRGELNFEDSLRQRVALLKGVDETELAKLSGLMTLNPGADILVRTMKKHGAYTALVSGGFTYFTSQIRELCLFDEDRANTLLIEEGRLSGLVSEPILGREAKLEATLDLTQKLKIDLSNVCAIGDGANDLAMLSAVGMGIGYHGKPIVQETAAFLINHTDHQAALFYQGYRRDEFC
ncbi:phosphoserine phosphatase SerB [Kiloniella laminariae]|uniref:Phosphoserine phosphatase n=1 Tax=Kiloniella laminariae TaxID=454162 RepID=A0ABT4LIJ2_9PROT|nr:phosphoserine phosphatase SerB [Kiloniella laminariae]MCZ4280755.1 phosphoserine phosphatase SerB [Kiloniella laminariae]